MLLTTNQLVITMDEAVSRIDKFLAEYESSIGFSNLDYNGISKIRLLIPGKLYLSGIEGYSAVANGTLHVDVVITVCFDTLPPGVISCQQHKYSIADCLGETWNDGKYLLEISEILDSNLKAGKRVLVHCMAGMSRSATAVLYWVVTRYLDRTTKEEDVMRAIKLLKNDRQCVYPNRGFIKLLLTV